LFYAISWIFIKAIFDSFIEVQTVTLEMFLLGDLLIYLIYVYRDISDVWKNDAS